jgi:hypothetical protein
MVEYNEPVTINAPYDLTLNHKAIFKNTDYWWVDLRCLQNDYNKPGILEVSGIIKCLKDISCYGDALMTASAPNNSGGGAVNMGHGWEYYLDPPRINLTDNDYHTLHLTAGSSYDYVNNVYLGTDSILANLKLEDLNVHGKIITDGQDLIINGTHVQITKSNGLNIYIGVEKANDKCLVTGYHADYNMGYMYIYGDPWYSGFTIGNEGTCYFGHGVYPEPGSSMKYLGDADMWWDYVYTYGLNLWWIQWWPALSDTARLDALKNCKTVVIQEKDGKTREVIDIDSMKFLSSDDSKGKFWSLNKTSGFLMGVCRDLLLEKEKQEQKIAELEQRLTTLETSAIQTAD